jgi:hypothetical protein
MSLLEVEDVGGDYSHALIPGTWIFFGKSISKIRIQW